MLPATTHPLATEEIGGMIESDSGIQSKRDTRMQRTERYIFVQDSSKYYGKLSHKNLDDLRSGNRALLVSGEDEKEDPLDFVLWKPKKEGEPAWESPWGEGRPGWAYRMLQYVQKIFG